MKTSTSLLSSILSLSVAFFALPATALDSINTVELQLESNAPIEGCQENITQALGKESITVARNPATADAVYKIRIVAEDGGLRTDLHWAVALFSTQGEKLFTDTGLESGWSAGGACSDLAPDLAEKLAKFIRQHSLMNF